MCKPNCNKGDIYRIEHIQSGKSYIGQVAHWTKRRASMVPKGASVRIRQHFRYAMGGSKSNDHPKLYNAIRKYGESAFRSECLKTCDISELDHYERYYIDLFDSVKNGYNITYGGQDRRPYDVEALSIKMTNLWKDKSYRDKQVSSRPRKYDLPYGISPKRDSNGEIVGYQVVIIRGGKRYGRVFGRSTAPTMEERFKLAVEHRDSILAELGEVA